MARYRKIDPRIWSDEKFRAFSREEKLIAIYCLTAQSNRIGIFRFSPALAAEDLDMPLETFRKAFAKVCNAVGWKFDEEARVLLVPKWFRYNQPANPNVLKSCLEDLHDLPQTPLLLEFRSCVEYLPQTFHETFRKGLGECFGKRYPKQSPLLEQEQEQEQYLELPSEVCSEPTSDSEPPHDEQSARDLGTRQQQSAAPTEGSAGKQLATRQTQDAKPVLVYPCRGKQKQWALLPDKVREYAEAFPGLDVALECRKALQWLRDNPQRRKTATGMPRFLYQWLAREANRGRPSRPPPRETPVRSVIEDYFAGIESEES